MPQQPKIQFTPAQAAAISARGGSLLVSAAAGSGKTRVLVERVVGLITDPTHPVDADSLLIMTFTNAAAAKLRADITTRLAQEVRANPGDRNLRRQQLRLQRAGLGEQTFGHDRHGKDLLAAQNVALIVQDSIPFFPGNVKAMLTRGRAARA